MNATCRRSLGAAPAAFALLSLLPACASSPPPPAAAPAPVADTTAAIPPATPPPPAPPPPAPRSADEILADNVSAIGPPEAWNAHKTVRLEMTMSFQGVGITGKAQRLATASDKTIVVTEIPGVGTIREGSNGKVFWSQDPINGLRLLDGAEADQARLESVWNPELRSKELFTKIEAKAETGPDGKPLECVVLTPKVAPPTTRCFDPASHLQVIEKGIRPTPQGDTPFSSTVSDWRRVGGLLLPFGLETQAGPITFSAKVQSIVFDEPMDDKQFEPPQPAGAAPPPGKPAGKSNGKTKAKAKAKPAP
jgi:hypothetical protein